VWLYTTKLRTNILEPDPQEELPMQRRDTLWRVQMRQMRRASKRGSGAGWRAEAHNVLRWARSQQIPVSLFGTLLGCSIAASLAAGYRPHGLREQASSLLPTWTVLALALLIAFQTFFINLTMPAQTIGVFLRCSFRIVSHDVSSSAAATLSEKRWGCWVLLLLLVVVLVVGCLL
jgi:hypothetical protein